MCKTCLKQPPKNKHFIGTLLLIMDKEQTPLPHHLPTIFNLGVCRRHPWWSANDHRSNRKWFTLGCLQQFQY